MRSAVAVEGLAPARSARIRLTSGSASITLQRQAIACDSSGAEFDPSYGLAGAVPGADAEGSGTLKVMLKPAYLRPALDGVAP